MGSFSHYAVRVGLARHGVDPLRFPVAEALPRGALDSWWQPMKRHRAPANGSPPRTTCTPIRTLSTPHPTPPPRHIAGKIRTVFTHRVRHDEHVFQIISHRMCGRAQTVSAIDESVLLLTIGKCRKRSTCSFIHFPSHLQTEKSAWATCPATSSRAPRRRPLHGSHTFAFFCSTSRPSRRTAARRWP